MLCAIKFGVSSAGTHKYKYRRYDYGKKKTPKKTTTTNNTHTPVNTASLSVFGSFWMRTVFLGCRQLVSLLTHFAKWLILRLSTQGKRQTWRPRVLITNFPGPRRPLIALAGPTPHVEGLPPLSQLQVPDSESNIWRAQKRNSDQQLTGKQPLRCTSHRNKMYIHKQKTNKHRYRFW